jgi:hypothetical protein
MRGTAPSSRCSSSATFGTVGATSLTDGALDNLLANVLAASPS